eukprot:6340257-Pyramimonas_sp.AAC.1
MEACPSRGASLGLQSNISHCARTMMQLSWRLREVHRDGNLSGPSCVNESSWRRAQPHAVVSNSVVRILSVELPWGHEAFGGVCRHGCRGRMQAQPLGLSVALPMGPRSV